MSKRNQHGLKDTFDSYRTFDGERYESWSIYPSPEQIKTYRAAGIKCRRVGDTLFLRPCDQETASAIDQA